MTSIAAFLKERLSLSIGRDAPDAGEFRAQQFKAVIGVTPLMMAANVVNALIICVAFSAKPFAMATFIWASLIGAMALVGYGSWHKSRRQPFPDRVSQRTLNRITRNSTILGFVWGALPLIVYPDGDLATKIIVTGFVAGMLGGGCFALYMVPTAR